MCCSLWHVSATKLRGKCSPQATDPMAQRKEEKAAAKASADNSFQAVATLWLEHWREGVTTRHAADTERRMKANFLPCIGARPIAEIEAPELVAMVKTIEERGARDIAKRALETTGQIFRYAIAHGYAKRNPAGRDQAATTF